KGQALAAHPVAALVFWWEQLERQIRITGHVEKLAATHSDAYFQKRPRGSRIGAHASPQSQVIANRCELEQRMAAAEKSFASHSIPRPSHWGGYLLRPAMIEFWQARRNRLHDRLRYTRRADRWVLERLAP
ncbi:MAG TPA: pyridoxal 5'-phosphate synthase, partial [Salinisphaeraceae bacterium]|nr:pyridoxal 5'-phosphate synthase [Salinisphaeraceae bacterium]